MAKKAKTVTTEAEASVTPVNPLDVSHINQSDVLLKLQAARVVASQMMPYVSVALFAMSSTRVDSLVVGGVPTMATDDKWRLYYHPLAVMNWSVKEIAGALLHEVGHCLRASSTRFKAMNEDKRYNMIYNIASDSLINQDLRADHIDLPGKPYYIESLKERHQVEATPDMTSEQIYYLLRKKIEEDCTCNQKGKKDDSKKDKSDSGEGDKEGDQPGDGSEGDQEGKGKGKGDKGKGEGDQPGDGSEGDQEGKGKGEGDQEGDGKGNQPGQGSGKGQVDPNCPVHGGHEHGDSGQPCQECMGIPDCGSVADGIAREYEENGNPNNPGVDEARADLVRQHVAVAIREHVKVRGTVPAGLERWADEFLDPVVDWRKELAFIVRKTYAQVSGIRDYTYNRTSRRQASQKQAGSNIIFPALRQPAPPRVAIVIDTSGSMSDDMLAWALSETQGVLRSIGSSSRGARVISCDAVATSQRITKASQVQLKGGGGTDMRIGIAEAMAKKSEKPDVVIVITDGFTPWPDEPLRNTTLIVALTDSDSLKTAPEWARKVLITRDDKMVRDSK